MRGQIEQRDYRALYERYLQGESGTAIAASVGMSFDGLYKAFRRHGWPIRSTRAAARLLVEQDPARARRLIEFATTARRGSHDTLATKEARALTRERERIGISAAEDELVALLHDEGHVVHQQTAIGPYNVDITLTAYRLAIEVDGGGHSKRSRVLAPERRAFIEGHGWRVIHVWAKSRTVGWQDRALRIIHAALSS